MKRVKRPVVLMVLAVLLLAGCSSSDDKSDSGSSPSTTSSESSELKNKLLTTSDLPGGYTQSTAGVAETGLQFCEGKFDISKRYPADGEAQAEFQKSGDAPLTGSFIAEILAEYSTDGAQQAFNGTQSAVQECATFEQTDPDTGTALKGQITTIPSFPTFGDQTLAIRLTGELTAQNTTVPLALEASFVREAGTLIGVANGGLGPTPLDSQLTVQLTEAAYQKVF